jgi:hypothetical protein
MEASCLEGLFLVSDDEEQPNSAIHQGHTISPTEYSFAYPLRPGDG